MISVSWGGGTNSVAGLLEMEKRDIMPDIILFADAGGEHPHTYQMIGVMNKWLRSKNWPQITVVKKVDFKGDVLTLEEDCIRRDVLPAIAYGFKTCSQKFKVAPQDKYLNNYDPAKQEWKAGRQITKVIFFDADEPQRAREYSDNKYINWYPLIEWDIGREDCVQLIKDAGLPQAGKSSCFFCPNSRVSEVRALNAQYPELMQRAIVMEQGADLTHIKGLGRGSFSWKNVIATDDMFEFPELEMPCECVT